MKHKTLGILILTVSLVLVGQQAGYVAADSFICGDIDGDNDGPNVADLSYLVAYLFKGGPPPPNEDAADIDGLAGVNVGDLSYLVDYLFRGGPVPVCRVSHGDIFGGWCIGSPMADSLRLSRNRVIPADCLDERVVEDSSYMWIELIGNDLHVHHMYAWYQCCLLYDVTFDVDGYNITAYEADLGELCDCYCHFNLESVLPNLEINQPCEYVVTLVGIEGDTVGVDTLVISDSTYMYVDVVGDDLHIHHMNALANCCPEFYVDFLIDGPNITVIETDSLGACYCMCYYNLKSILNDVSPGEHYVTLIGVCDPWGGGCDTVGVDTVVVGDTVK